MAAYRVSDIHGNADAFLGLLKFPGPLFLRIGAVRKCHKNPAYKSRWIDIDCGASYAAPGHAFTRLCLDNLAELYRYKPSRSREMKAVLYY